MQGEGRGGVVSCGKRGGASCCRCAKRVGRAQGEGCWSGVGMSAKNGKKKGGADAGGERTGRTSGADKLPSVAQVCGPAVVIGRWASTAVHHVGSGACAHKSGQWPGDFTRRAVGRPMAREVERWQGAI